MEVPIHLVGLAPAVDTLGGILMHGIDRISVEALPTDVPSFIEVDVSGLEHIDAALHVSDLTIPSGVEVLTDMEELVAKVTPCFENGKAGIARNLTNGVGFGSSEFYVLRPSDRVLAEFVYFCVTHRQFREPAIEPMVEVAFARWETDPNRIGGLRNLKSWREIVVADADTSTGRIALIADARRRSLRGIDRRRGTSVQSDQERSSLTDS